MIGTLQALPELTEGWLRPLKATDRQLYEELAESLVIGRARHRVDIKLPAGVSEALSEVDLSRKEIGAFRFAPAEGDTINGQITGYDRLIKQDYDVERQVVFIGQYGAGYVFVSPEGVGLLDTVPQPPRIRALARDLTSFLIVQANAYDAYKRFIVKSNDISSYRYDAQNCAELPALAGSEVLTVFEAQLTA